MPHDIVRRFFRIGDFVCEMVGYLDDPWSPYGSRLMLLTDRTGVSPIRIEGSDNLCKLFDELQAAGFGPGGRFRRVEAETNG
jgi:hypothetical protein